MLTLTPWFSEFWFLSSAYHIFGLNFLFLFFSVFVFLGPYSWHMEVSRLGVKLELQVPAYTTTTAMPDPSASTTTSHRNAKFPTHWARPGIKAAFPHAHQSNLLPLRTRCQELLGLNFLLHLHEGPVWQKCTKGRNAFKLEVVHLAIRKISFLCPLTHLLGPHMGWVFALESLSIPSTCYSG